MVVICLCYVYEYVGAKMNGVKIYEGVHVESVTERIVNGKKYVSGTSVVQSVLESILSYIAFCVCTLDLFCFLLYNLLCEIYNILFL